ncbi:MAG: hypothetical protein GDA50_04790 [Alphaproteobacteria bacterium GM202ARS2]|nr:hypothetical protein [Alphaproteobacteria bacterium GM202ARS2]
MDTFKRDVIMEIDKNELNRHKDDWQLFISMTIWLSAITGVILIGLALFVA